MICRLEKRTDVIAVTLAPSCSCSGESWWNRVCVGSSQDAALLLILLSFTTLLLITEFYYWYGVRCSHLVLKPPILSNRSVMLKSFWVFMAPSLAFSQLLFWSCDTDCRGLSVISPLICQNLIHDSSEFFHCSSNISQFPANIWWLATWVLFVWFMEVYLVKLLSSG